MRTAQLYLSLFLIPVAVGTLAGGVIGDRIGRKYVIWFSVLGALPFSLMLPYMNLFWTGVLSVFIGLTLSSSFPAIVVYAQELVPGKVGTISGLFFGFAFGLSGLGAAAFGLVADHTSVEFVYRLTFVPSGSGPACRLAAGPQPRPATRSRTPPRARSILEHRAVIRNREGDSLGVSKHNSPSSEVNHGQAVLFGSA